MTIRIKPILRGLAASLFTLALGTPPAMAADPVSLTLYNGQHKEIGEAIAKAYEAKTGIHINIRKGSSNQLASQIIEEGDRSPADVIYTEESPPLTTWVNSACWPRSTMRPCRFYPRNTLPTTAPGWV